eukprot:Skav207809  [mRNA]  locus=scaffold381:274142:276343:+ [translate_table: standard]
MVAFSNGIGLEYQLKSLTSLSRTSVKATVIFCSPGRHLCKTYIHQQFFTTNAELSPGELFTIVGGIVHQKTGPHLEVDQDSHVLHLKEHSTAGLSSSIEVCAGLGAAGRGFECAGTETKVYAEINPKYAEWLRQQTRVPVIQGNIADHHVMAKIHEVFDEQHIMFGGVSCQPFSRLGDQGGFNDDRSQSFVGLLHCGYFLHSLSIVAECTQEALSSGDVQELLSIFAKETNMEVHQKVLHLHNTWASKRTRWWAIISPKWLKVDGIPELPELRFCPTPIHVTPSLISKQDEYMKQLHLDIEELRVFYNAKKPVSAFAIDVNRTLPTATHSFGSQAKGCMCGCRAEGFHPQRIQDKGLHALLIPTGEVCRQGEEYYDGFRHPHPQELSLFNGLQPSWISPEVSNNARLDLSGVGQLASPLQAGWVIAQLHAAAEKAGFVHSTKHPRCVVADLCRELIQERKQIFSDRDTDLTLRLEHAIEALDRPRIFYPFHEFPVEAVDLDGAATQAIRKWCESHDRPPAKKPRSTPSIAPHLQQKVDSRQVESSNHSLKITHHADHTYAPTGGVSFFASKSQTHIQPANPDNAETKQPEQTDRASHEDTSAKPTELEVTPTIPWKIEEPVEPSESPAHASDSLSRVWIGIAGQELYSVSFTGTKTVGEIAQSQAKTQGLDPDTVTTMTIMGLYLPINTPVYHDQMILLRPCEEATMHCPLTCDQLHAPDVAGLPRRTALWNQ